MAEPLVIGLPPGLDVSAGYSLVFEALDAATGAAVAGVKVSNATFEVMVTGGSTDVLDQPILLTYATPSG